MLGPIPERLFNTPFSQGDASNFMVTRPWRERLTALNSASGQAVQFFTGTHGARAQVDPGAVPDGSFYEENDRGLTYQVRSGIWKYAFGIMSTTQAGLPGDFAAADAGALLQVSDYGHLLIWSGSAYGWAPGDAGSGMIQGFLGAPTGAGWHLCDGATVKRLNADGTTSDVTLPDYATARYLKLGTAAIPGPTAASGSTDSVSGGTPPGSNSNPATGAPSATTVVDNTLAGSTVAVGSGTHTHNTTAPVFTGNPLAGHVHGPNTLELSRTQLAAYYRQ